ncbi:hypothetical protein PC118_g17799 [Phytophthora cactorum]|uniref:Reverse transcriptase Ty1/copia-type domain-containing protein n=2 Tax=Phytophthora cactorum TaxID=29920 RepID=A0A8T1FGW1_9STRA|nr:hypothetical protein PC111_g18962 [Phytophthora cactorum]KAG2805860.1 hypothetical protein PC112_g18081 [Phytophthora cactorum]KAG2916109.1 hypothetical protein PC115_g11153 [Phytophthora cactorum]KAG2968804.1 hypothetical protein PC118_g17799 [Phytophthora cactorum]KAG3061249.1 hypothetical protein PC122_g19721 [Phytophthora cactorum]
MPSAYVKADKEGDIEILLHIPLGMMISEVLLKLLGVKVKRELALRLKKGLCIYGKVEDDGMTLVGVYVDDLLVTGTSESEVDKFFEDMQIVELKDLGVVAKFLGIAFNYDDTTGWMLDQEQVIEGMLEKFKLDKAAPVCVPISGEQDGEDARELLPSDGAGTPERPTIQTFRSLVGSLLWIACIPYTKRKNGIPSVSCTCTPLLFRKYPRCRGRDIAST